MQGQGMNKTILEKEKIILRLNLQESLEKILAKLL